MYNILLLCFIGCTGFLGKFQLRSCYKVVWTFLWYTCW